MIDIDTTTIERFLLNVKRVSQARGKELRIDLADAVSLATEISMVMARLVRTEVMPIVIQQTSTAADGGRF